MVTRVRIEATAQTKDGVESALNDAFGLLFGSRYMPRESEFIEEVLETDIDQDSGAIGWKGRRVIRFWASVGEYEEAHNPHIDLEVQIDLGDVGATRSMVTTENELAWKIAISALDESGLEKGDRDLALYDASKRPVGLDALVGSVEGPVTLAEAPLAQPFVTGTSFTAGTAATAIHPTFTYSAYPSAAANPVIFTKAAGIPTHEWGTRLTIVVKGKEVNLWPESRQSTIWETVVKASRIEGEKIDENWEIRDPDGNKVHPTARVTELTGDRFFLNPRAGTGG